MTDKKTVFNVGDGADIHYRLEGRENAPVLLMLHGGFGSLDDFDPLVPLLREDFRVLRVDSRGHGRSTLGMRPLTYEQLQEDVEHLLQHEGIRRFNVMGFSDGGTVGYRLACQRMLQVDKLITLGATWRIRADTPLYSILAGITGESWRAKFPKTYESYQRLNPRPDFDRLAKAAVAMWTDLAASGHPNERISDIECPLLVVRGDDDHLVPLEELIKLKRCVQGTRILNIPFAGHEVHKDQKTMVLDCLRQFLAA